MRPDPATVPDGPSAYLDHAASTPMRPEAVEAMLPFLAGTFANPSGAHGPSRSARRALDAAREELASVVGCEPDEVVFTSGGTEADNLAVLGAHAGRPGPVLASAVEHRAVLAPVRAVGGTVVPVDARGVVDLDAARELATGARRDGGAVTLASLMAVNSETGVVQPVERFCEAVRAVDGDTLVHCDAAQALAWLDVSAATSRCDLVTLSAHKFGGPKGTGALVVRGRAARVLRPVAHGGGQERELRPGTQNVAGAVAMAVAARLAAAERDATVRRVAALRDRLADGLADAVGALEPAPRALRVAGSCHLRFPGVVGEELVLLADREGVSTSTGSACASGAREPSHVLVAMGWDEASAAQAVRISLGATTTAAEVDHALRVVVRAVRQLRLGAVPAR
ncbi:MAG TPA: cysteine desulfurase family protein [Acidimicrobiales bacterium]|nr:cysteine desulfurase family protein [Acidimicrobiales bacterium]